MLESVMSENNNLKNAYNYMKEETLKVKSEFHLKALEYDRLATSLVDLQASKTRIEQKYDTLKLKQKSFSDHNASLQTELTAYETFNGRHSNHSKGLEAPDQPTKS